MTNTDPIKMSVRTPLMATSIKLAGLNKPSCKVTFSALKLGFSSCNARSMARVTPWVLAPN